MVTRTGTPLHGIVLTLLRIVTGLLYMEHGAQKLFGWLGGPQVATLASLLGVAGILEFFGGALIVLGLLTRPVAFLLSGEMAVAYFTVHAPRGFWPIENQGELTALYSFVYLFFAVWGSGPWGLDALWHRRHDNRRGRR